jgi:hypothetical protein
MVIVSLLPLPGCDVKVNVGGEENGEAATSVDGGSETRPVGEPSDGDGESFGLNLPGLDVNVNKKTGVSVRAPGVEVDANKDGVKGKAPDTSVEVKPGD